LREPSRTTVKGFENVEPKIAFWFS
jgi:hypothetical protein